MDYSMKRLTSILTLSLVSLPAYAWPEVDHMNMCGSATKVVRGYSGNFRTWNAHDNYVSYLGNNYYLRTNCPKIVAPVKKKGKKSTAKKKQITKAVNKVIKESVKRNKVIKRIFNSKYNEKTDCKRVDRLNSLGLSVQVNR
jgi:hypothetical protein